VTTGGAPRLERVVLVEEEVVVRGRTRRVTFRVQVNDGWVPASRHETARPEQLSRGPGVVFRTRVELSLLTGTLVERSSSDQLLQTRNALDHLVADRKGPQRRVTRTRLAVQPGGELREFPPATK
jgi:hypothetical protein